MVRDHVKFFDVIDIPNNVEHQLSSNSLFDLHDPTYESSCMDEDDEQFYVTNNFYQKSRESASITNQKNIQDITHHTNQEINQDTHQETDQQISHEDTTNTTEQSNSNSSVDTSSTNSATDQLHCSNSPNGDTVNSNHQSDTSGNINKPNHPSYRKCAKVDLTKQQKLQIESNYNMKFTFAHPLNNLINHHFVDGKLIPLQCLRILIN